MTTVLTNGLFDILVDVIPSMIVMVSAAAKKVKKSNKELDNMMNRTFLKIFRKKLKECLETAVLWR